VSVRGLCTWRAGWQSDIGATFMYSGTERFPEGPTLTPRVAAVRTVLLWLLCWV